ncbi:hypothetical protein ACROYT_G011169 [Oculina patagonica]
MNSKLVTVVLILAILASTFVSQSEAFTMGAGGVGGKRQLETCEGTANRLQRLCAFAETACSAPDAKRGDLRQ